MSSLTVEFAFEIGDLVYFKSATHDIGNTPVKFVVYERLAQECHGGVQRLYRVLGVKDWVPEIVLTSVLPPYTPGVIDRISEQNSIRDQQRAADELWYTLQREVRKNTVKE